MQCVLHNHNTVFNTSNQYYSSGPTVNVSVMLHNNKKIDLRLNCGLTDFQESIQTSI